MIEHPCHVYSDSISLKQKTGHIIPHNRAAHSFKIKSWWHTTLWTAPCHLKCTVATSVYAKQPCNNLQWSITQSFSPQICIALDALLLKLHKCALLFTQSLLIHVSAHLSELWHYSGNWAKSRGWALFCESTVIDLMYAWCSWHKRWLLLECILSFWAVVANYSSKQWQISQHDTQICILCFHTHLQ